MHPTITARSPVKGGPLTSAGMHPLQGSDVRKKGARPLPSAFCFTDGRLLTLAPRSPGVSDLRPLRQRPACLRNLRENRRACVAKRACARARRGAACASFSFPAARGAPPPLSLPSGCWRARCVPWRFFPLYRLGRDPPSSSAAGKIAAPPPRCSLAHARGGRLTLLGAAFSQLFSTAVVPSCLFSPTRSHSCQLLASLEPLGTFISVLFGCFRDSVVVSDQVLSRPMVTEVSQLACGDATCIARVAR